jgi:hypothetical protein
MKKTSSKVRLSEQIAGDVQIELLYAAAVAHPDWEILPEGMGIRHIGSEGTDTPQKLLDWFKRKGRH